MRLPASRVPLAILAAAALALALGRATGGDGEPAGVPAEPLARERAAPAAPRAVPALALARARRAAGEDDAVADLFSGRSWAPQPVPAAQVVAPPPPKPAAPPLPFIYLGRLEADGEKPVVYLQRGAAVLAVSEGDVLEPDYRVESVSAEELVIVFLPLAERQRLRAGSEP